METQTAWVADTSMHVFTLNYLGIESGKGISYTFAFVVYTVCKVPRVKPVSHSDYEVLIYSVATQAIANTLCPRAVHYIRCSKACSQPVTRY